MTRLAPADAARSGAPAAEETALWYYARGGDKTGPLPRGRLDELAASGGLRATDFVRRKGTRHWVRAGDVLKLPPAAAAPAAAPVPDAESPTGGKVAWVKAAGLLRRRHALLAGGVVLLVVLAVVVAARFSGRGGPGPDTTSPPPGGDSGGDRPTGERSWADAGNVALDQDASAIALSPDGKTLAALGAEVRLYDLDGARRPRTVGGSAGAGGGALVYDPTGRRLAWSREEGPKGRLFVWDGGSGDARPLAVFDHAAPDRAMAFSADGRFLAATDPEDDPSGGVRVWEAATGREWPKVPGKGPIAFSRSGAVLAVQSRLAPAEVVLWDVEGQKAGPTLHGGAGGRMALAFGVTDRQLFAASTRSVEIWNLDAPGLPIKLDWGAAPAAVRAADFAGDDRTAAVVRTEKVWQGALFESLDALDLWDLPTGRVARLDREGEPCQAVAFSADGGKLASLRGRSVRLWEERPGREGAAVFEKP